MELGTLIITLAAIAFVLTLAVSTLFKSHKHWLMTYLQNFVGVLFIFSGFVKAIDPLGTAYKMEQYFAEFQTLFEGTLLSFLAPLFPLLATYSIWFSVFMIVFEIVIGVMLLIGSKPKLTSWSFLLLVVFFTILTGFTFLTGYVPSGVDFFSFGQWGPYDPEQMKVTDCGCFGDFLVLDPRISFMKDLVLLVPAFYFIFRHKDMHQLFTKKARSWIVGGITMLLVVYCISNYAWDLPHIDFRPFQKGVNIAEKKALEEKAEANVTFISFLLRNRLSGKYVELPYKQYMDELSSYPKTDWENVSRKMTEPTVPHTKISDFIIYGPSDDDITSQILTNDQPFFMFVCHKVYYDGFDDVTTTYTDTITTVDTIISGVDTTYEAHNELKTREVSTRKYHWDASYIDRFRKVIIPMAEEASKAGVKSIVVFGGADQEMILDLKRAASIPFTACTADDILLKTIVRSNPGTVLMKGGQILDKWHYKKLPSFSEISNTYIN